MPSWCRWACHPRPVSTTPIWCLGPTLSRLLPTDASSSSSTAPTLWSKKSSRSTQCSTALLTSPSSSPTGLPAYTRSASWVRCLSCSPTCRLQPRSGGSWLRSSGRTSTQDFHLLGIGFISAAQYGGKVPGVVPSDLAGKRIRSGGAIETEIIEALGWDPGRGRYRLSGDSVGEERFRRPVPELVLPCWQHQQLVHQLDRGTTCSYVR